MNNELRVFYFFALFTLNKINYENKESQKTFIFMILGVVRGPQKITPKYYVITNAYKNSRKPIL